MTPDLIPLPLPFDGEEFEENNCRQIVRIC